MNERERQARDARLAKIFARAQLIVPIVCAAAVVALRSRGVRYVGNVPLLALITLPYVAVTFAYAYFDHAPRSRWIRMAFGGALLVAVTIYVWKR